MLDSCTMEENLHLHLNLHNKESYKKTSTESILEESLGVKNISKDDLLIISTILKEYKSENPVSSRITNIMGFLTELEIDNIPVENTKLYQKTIFKK